MGGGWPPLFLSPSSFARIYAVARARSMQEKRGSQLGLSGASAAGLRGHIHVALVLDPAVLACNEKPPCGLEFGPAMPAYYPTFRQA